MKELIEKIISEIESCNISNNEDLNEFKTKYNKILSELFSKLK